MIYIPFTILFIAIVFWLETYPARMWFRNLCKEVDEQFSVRPVYKIGKYFTIYKA